MRTRALFRTALAATLFSAIPLSSVNAVVSPAPTASTNSQASHLANLKAHGTTEIERRLSNLTAALTKLSGTAKLTAADKTALTNQINAEISSLTALKSKLTADADLTTARADVKSIVNDYRVYVLLLPKTRMVASADRFSQVETQLTSLAAKLQAKVDADKTAGQDVSAMQKSLDDLKAKVADAQQKSTSVIAPLLALQPTDYNQNHTVLVNYRSSLQTAHTDVMAARDDAKSVIQSLKGAKSSASPTASPAKSK